MADQYYPAANVPAGGEDTSDRFGPYITGGGDVPATIPGYPPNVATTDPTYPAGPSAAGISVPRAVFHDDRGQYVVHSDMTADSSNPPNVTDHDGDDGLPDVPRYEGPDMGDVDSRNVLPAPMVNPSAGNQAGVEQGLANVNPVGPTFAPGDLPPSRLAQVVPDTTKDLYPRGGGASIGPRG